MYNTTAFLYDKTAAFEAQEAVQQKLEAAFVDNGIHKPGPLGDLGCGTGLMTVSMAQAGWQIEGLELTAAMLQQAQKKVEQLDLVVQERLTLRQADITVPSHFAQAAWQGAYSLHNTLNHLPDLRQISQVAANLSQTLQPGALFICDTDTEASFKAYFDHGPVTVWQEGKRRLRRSCRYNAKTGRANHLALLEQEDAKGWRVSSQEAMVLQYHKEIDLLVLFEKSGFTCLAQEAFNPNPTLYRRNFSPKTWWVFKKVKPH